MRASSPLPSVSGRVGVPIPADAPCLMAVLELLLLGAVCYILGLLSGALLIPRLVDRGLFPVRGLDRRER